MTETKASKAKWDQPEAVNKRCIQCIFSCGWTHTIYILNFKQAYVTSRGGWKVPYRNNIIFLICWCGDRTCFLKRHCWRESFLCMTWVCFLARNQSMALYASAMASGHFPEASWWCCWWWCWLAQLVLFEPPFTSEVLAHRLFTNRVNVLLKYMHVLQPLCYIHHMFHAALHAVKWHLK